MLRRLLGRKSPAARPARVAQAPDGLRIYAIGDIHGRSDLLDRMHEMIATDLASHPPPAGWRAVVVHLGDYVDRGADSRGVLDRVLERRLPGAELVYLKGNHEQMLEAAVRGSEPIEAWRSLGGLETMLSYGMEPRLARARDATAEISARLGELIPRAHLQTIAAMPLTYRAGDYMLCHAGVRPGVALDRQRPEDLLWIRGAFLDSEADHGALIVHGHTPVEAPEERHNRINIDTGAYATNLLTCLVLEGARRDYIATVPPSFG
ncbi:MAG: metallophosphoesterase family protein [Hyphomicrobiaceae bacterium]